MGPNERELQRIPDRLDIDLAKFKQISKYYPKLADFLIFKGWFNTYFGIINYVDDKKIGIIKESTPLLLLTMDQRSMEQLHMIKTKDIIGSRGTYSVLQGDVWYV